MANRLHLTTSDGARLGGACFHPTPASDRWVVVGGATAVPHTYYHPLAEWLADRAAVNVLTFDYRGVGDSAPDGLRGYAAGYLDWVTDLDAAIAHAAGRGPTVVVSHSFGGQAYGLGEGHRRTRGLYAFGMGAGWHGFMSFGEALKARLFWHVITPPAVALWGYLPARRLGFGEDLPRGVYRDWKRWCGFPDHFFDDPGLDAAARYARVEAPVVGINASDDAWSGPESAAVLLSRYPNADAITVEPSRYGLDAIGHMRYVRPACEALWTPLVVWLEERFGGPSRR